MRAGIFRPALALVFAALAIWLIAEADARVTIVGGSAAPAASWPSIVALVPAAAPDYLSAYCGGTLIDPQWVLTAGHCVEDAAVDQPGEVDVALGVTNLATDAGQRRDVDRIVRHPGYAAGGAANDAALLHLSAPATLGTSVQIVDVVGPLRAELWDAGSPAEIAGWGLTDPDQPPTSAPVDLQHATVPITTDALCSSLMTFTGALTFSAASMVCAGDPAGGAATCSGDSGGPLAVADGAQRRLVGVVSWGSTDCGAPDTLGVYARLDAMRDFVFGPAGLGVGAPGAPTQVAAVRTSPGSTSATVSWTAPPAGGRAIADFVVQVIDGGVPASRVVVPGTSTHATIPSLTGGPYTFTVRSEHGAGAGPASARAALTEPAAAPPPPSPPGPAPQTQAPAAATPPAASTSTAPATLPAATPAVPSIRIIGTPRLTQSRGGVVTIRMRVVATAAAKLTLRVLDHRGAPRLLRRPASRLGASRPATSSVRRLTTTVGASGVVEVVAAVTGRREGPRRIGRVVFDVATPGGVASVRRPFTARL